MSPISISTVLKRLVDSTTFLADLEQKPLVEAPLSKHRRRPIETAPQKTILALPPTVGPPPAPKVEPVKAAEPPQKEPVKAAEPPPTVEFAGFSADISKAGNERYRAILAPTLGVTTNVRSALDLYETLFRRDAERQVQNTILSAFGSALLPEDASYAAAKSALRVALVALLRLTDDDDDTTAIATAADTEKGGGEKDEPPPPKVQAPLSLVRVCDNIAPELEARARALINTIDDLRQELTGMHPLRVNMVLQLRTAQVRDLLPQLPATHPMHWQLSKAIPIMERLKWDSGVEGFILGFARSHTADWAQVTVSAQRRLDQFDYDAGLTPGEDRESHAPKSSPKKGTSSSHKWPTLPALRALTRDRTILLVGGLVVSGKVETIQERFGIAVEWVEIGDTARTESAAQRIRSNTSIGAVLINEGFMAHKTAKVILDACNAAEIPYGMCDKCGIASVEAGLNELDRKLARSA